MSFESCGVDYFWIDDEATGRYNLMPCQLCNHPAHMMDNVSESDSESDTIHKYEQAECPQCGVRGPAALWDPAPIDRRGNLTCAKSEFVEFFTRQNAKHRPRASALWNEMMAKIARGNLLDETTKRKVGRL